MSSPITYTSHSHGPHTIHYRTYDTEADLRHILSLVSPSLSEPYSVYTYRYFLLKWSKSCIFAFLSKSPSTNPTNPPTSPTDEDTNFDCVGCCICKVDVTEGTGEEDDVIDDVEKREDSNVEENSNGDSGSKLKNALKKIALTPPPPPPPLIRTGYIGMLSTLPTLQSLGLATRMLLLSLYSLVNDYNVSGVTLEVEEGNSAMHVYRNMGFVEVGRWKGYYLNGNGARRFKMCVSKTSLPKGVGK